MKFLKHILLSITFSFSKVIPLTRETFKTNVLVPGTSWVVDFYAPWCQHCQKLKPHFKQASASFDEVMWGTFNCEDDRKFCESHGVRGYPTIQYFRDGNMVNELKLSGKSERELVDFARRMGRDALFPLSEIEESLEFLKKADAKTFLLIDGSDEVTRLVNEAAEPFKQLHRFVAISELELPNLSVSVDESRGYRNLLIAFGGYGEDFILDLATLENLSKEAISNFIRRRRFRFGEFHTRNFNLMKSSGEKDLVVLITDPQNKTVHDANVKRIYELSKVPQFGEMFYFGWMNVNGPFTNPLHNSGLANVPRLIVFEKGHSRLAAYDQEQMTLESAEDALSKVLSGEISFRKLQGSDTSSVFSKAKRLAILGLETMSNLRKENPRRFLMIGIVMPITTVVSFYRLSCRLFGWPVQDPVTNLIFSLYQTIRGIF
eukprot:GHVP01031489.1.p1 GENE.GHVP01031489.1~~GHVP01031489.1.p1  ORF type:complete len:439 (+),score=66.02 GHVP01031489.1:24-1319(+)